MSGRILMVCFGLIIGYFAIYFGDGMYQWGTADANAPRGKSNGAFELVAIATFVFVIIGCFVWFFAMVAFVGDWDEAKEIESATAATLAFVCLACVFGVAATPFTTYGAYPWYWTSRWDVLPLLAFVPTAIVIHGIVDDIVRAQRSTGR